jgi:hypothetical protein
MRDNRPYGSEGGEGDTFPTPIGLPYHLFKIPGTSPVGWWFAAITL